MLIRGGPANSGTKRALREPQREPWTCLGKHSNPPYATRCLTLGCREKRP